MAKTEERVKEIRHLLWKKRMRRIKVVSLILGVIILFVLVLNVRRILTAIFWNMEIFRVKEVKIIPENARPLLTRVLTVENPGNLLFLNIDEWNEMISKIQEVERSFITKEFPSTLRIEVILRKPWVLIERNWGGIFIDREGKIIESSENSSYFVKVSGIETEGNSVAESDLWKLDVVKDIERWYNHFNIQRYFLMKKITITKPTEIILNETEGLRRIIITSDNIEEAFKKVKIILGECEKSSKEWEYIDGRFNNPSVKYKTSQNKQ